jgi:hypothetical protein
MDVSDRIYRRRQNTLALVVIIEHKVEIVVN